MNAADDQQLVRDFAARGGEESFRTLVTRYTDLVYGTSLRIVRDAGAAQEVTQNVFIALARKAVSLPADTPLTAWLHRAAVLESKNWIRGELRRKQREQIAGGLMTDPDEPLLAALTSVLDDALLDLREKDRAALLARFMQQRSLKEVGATLGVSEDTAQKRVAKALDLLTRAFRKRGYHVPTAAISLTVLQGATQVAPIGLIATASAAGLAVSANFKLGAFALLAAKFMSLTKTQTATLCVLLGAAPVAYQLQVNQQAHAGQRQLEQTFRLRTASLEDLESRRSALARENIITQSELDAARAQLSRALVTPGPILPSAAELYTWSETSDFIRLPKDLLDEVHLTPVKQVLDEAGNIQAKGRGEILADDGTISPVLLEALGLDAAQTENVQSAFKNFVQEFETVARAQTHLTNTVPPGVGMYRPNGVQPVTLRTVAFPKQGATLRANLEQHLISSIGPERTEILLEKQAAGDLENDYLGFGKYDKYIAAVRGDHGMFTVGQSRGKDGVNFNASVRTVRYEDLPDELKPYFRSLPPQEN